MQTTFARIKLAHYTKQTTITKCNHFAYLVILFITSISLKKINCDGQLSSTQNTKLNLTIAAILPLLKKPEGFQSTQHECSNVLRPDALQTVSALHYALDMIESDKTILKNFTLTVDVIANCQDSIVEMRHLSNVIERLQVEPIDAKNALIGVIYSNDLAALKYDTIFQSFANIPLISCSGPPTDIANMNEVKTDSRDDFITVTSRHIFIADVIFEILRRYNWKYIAIFSYDATCRTDDMIEFFNKRARELAGSDEVCIGHFRNPFECLFEKLFPDVKYNHTLIFKHAYNTVDVIICYCHIEEIRDLKNRLQDSGQKYVVIAGHLDKPWKDGEVPWTSDLGELYYVTATQQYDEKFYNYYVSLSMENKTRYLTERYLNAKFYSENMKNGSSADMLRETYNNNSNIANNIIKSVYSMAHAIKDSFVRYDEPDRTIIKSKLRLVDFKLFDEEVSFTSLRGLPKFEKFDIHKFQEIKNVANTFVKVGEYSKYGDNDHDTIGNEVLRMRGNLTMLDSAFQFSKDYEKQACGKPCTSGYFKKQGKNSCCWDCVECDEFEVSKGDSVSCVKCENDSVPNKNKTACISVSVIFELPTEWTDVENLISIAISSLSIVLTGIVSLVFIKYQNTPAVKSTTKELCYIMFAGIILVNVTLLVSKVTQTFKTADVKVVPAIGFTMVYAALLVKTNRIARILIPSKHKFANIHPTYVSLKAQITITSILIGIEIVICWFAVQFHDPGPSTGGSDFILRKYYLNGAFFCKIFGFVALLILLCTYYAIKTRNLPTNFNETKCIGFAMYATTITAVAFSLVYFTSKKKILALNLCASINSLTILIFLFSPKLFIILWKPEKNTKACFSPIAGNIRSFIGNISRPSSRRPSDQCYSLENTEPQNVDYLKENVQDPIVNVIKELDDILDTGLKSDKKKMNKKVDIDDSESEDTWQRAYLEVFNRVKSCHNELNRIQESCICLLKRTANSKI